MKGHQAGGHPGGIVGVDPWRNGVRLPHQGDRVTVEGQAIETRTVLAGEGFQTLQLALGLKHHRVALDREGGVVNAGAAAGRLLGVARVGGETYPLGLHGFAMGERFEVVGQGADHVTLRLTQSAATLAQYPFPFTLEVTYRLDASGIEVSGLIRNPGDASMPYAFGLHPGFRWPLAGGDKADYRLVFNAPERAEVPVIAPGGLFSQQMRPVPIEGRRLRLDDALFAREALCFLGAASKGLSFEGPGGRLRMEWEGFPHLVVWSKPGAPFLCLETWTGHGDPEGFEGDLFAKPSMITLPPGGEGRHRVRHSFL